MPDALLWSVMIPVYNRTDHLEQCLRSVLDAGLAPAVMQIAVVDDSTENSTVEEQVRRIAGDRVEYHHNPRNLGMAGNWNRCIELARGELVHILHDDDFVLPGFHASMGQLASRHPEASIYLGRSLLIDSHGSVRGVSERLRSHESLSRNPEPLLYRCAIRFPAVVARRDAYARIGGFDATLRMALDWDMWARLIADRGGVAMDALVAAYREHEGSATFRYFRDGTYAAEMLEMSDRFQRLYSGFNRARFCSELELDLWRFFGTCRFTRDLAPLRVNRPYWRRVVPWHRRARYAMARLAEEVPALLKVWSVRA